ncbi:protoheme IX farnesyltransferase [Brucella abortus 87/28]|nr:protoheme IX farnesyltransferase [Brucella abortus 65/110]ENR86993.1 protoheme IX farnesyltransferase [Brucella abortus 78/14]ENR98330.1 protoheme IX farnesyltransferase [Brucella abortus 80/28]ENS06383.1 protoheme IX farnesyltransferase [Brucella abortus 87/28]ENS30552.1 protoheme IX farnesyltransferase [Brucella abortus F6/05-4]ENS36094.1 protoheme IX farnesyltransferase [Brucella abortus F6/05-9]
MSLVVFTGLVGLVLAPGHMNPVLAVISILCIAVGAGALNMWYDADIDAVMKRTRKRPIPAGIIAPNQVLAFGLTLSAFSVMTLGLMVNWLAAALLAFTIFFYAVIYTMWLKRSTPQNIVIGGAAGAFPPMIGWAAATGEITWDSLVLFMIIFLWTPPHFWALSLFTTNDYEAARIPMMPNVKGELSTRRQALFYAVLMAPVGVLPWVMGLRACSMVWCPRFWGLPSSIMPGACGLRIRSRRCWLRRASCSVFRCFTLRVFSLCCSSRR